jgi:ActR/RegA family two-component response regulator
MLSKSPPFVGEYDTLVAFTGEDALISLRGCHLDYAILDLAYNDMAIDKFLLGLSQVIGLPKIIFLTEQHGPAVDEAAKQFRAQVLKKPATIAEILGAFEATQKSAS